ncbi:protein zyg-11 homolog [Saccoglossus kowalevskii]
MMFCISADTLQDICLQFISSNLNKLCYPCREDDQQVIYLKYKDIFLHADLADSLLQRLNEKRPIDDVLLSLFANPTTTQLKRAHLKDAKITPHALRFLSKHKLVDLDISSSWTGRHAISGNDVLESLSLWTINHLQVLNLSAVNLFVNYRQPEYVSGLWSELRSLSHLTISKTDTNDAILQILTDKITKLECLDISQTKVTDIKCLEKYQDSLKSLILADLSTGAELFSTLSSMKRLCHLDISKNAEFNSARIMNDSQVGIAVNEFLADDECLPCITAIDLSGWKCIDAPILKGFLSNHPSLQFVGLMLTPLCDADYISDEGNDEFNADLQVTGTANERQLITALTFYSNRCHYAQKTLFHLFSLTQNTLLSDYAMIKAIFVTLRNFPTHLNIQMAGSATMFNLVKSFHDRLHISILSQIVELALAAMKTFLYSQQLQKNCLLILYNDTVLKEVKFNRFRVASLCMQCLHTYDDNPMKTMAVYILSEAALKINTEEIEQLAVQSNMKKLLDIVKEKIEARHIDYALKFTLSALWNLTDECPSSCYTFIQQQGVEIFLEMLECFPDEENLQTKVLGLLNNVAEVKRLRTLLIKQELIQQLNLLLDSSKIEVSYFAAGVVSHIISSGPSIWTLPIEIRNELIGQLYKVVNNWTMPESTVVAYRSFQPFISLLHCETAAAQLWAVWAILYVCTIHEEKYCRLLISDGGIALLQSLCDNPLTDINVKVTASKVLKLLIKYQHVDK